MLSPVQVWRRKRCVTNYVPRQQSQQCEIEQMNVRWAAMLSGTLVLISLTTPINYSLGLLWCKILPNYYTAKL
jgi:hypothetical protein